MRQRLRNRFRLLVVVQVLLLIATIAGLVATLFTTSHVAVPILLGVAVIVETLALMHTVYAHVDALEEFFAAVRYEDFTQRFIADDLDTELKDAFNSVIERFRDTRADRDQYATYLDTVIRHVPVPFMAVRSDGSVALANGPLRRLTGLPALHNIGDLGQIDPGLPERLAAIAAGSQQLLQTAIRGIPVELRVSKAEIRLDGKVERLYSIENLSGELTARESSAWRNLIRVLTHEIMNTLTPVTSLAHTAEEMLGKSPQQDPQAEDVREAVATIGRRSEGLIDFVSRYRELLQVPVAQREELLVSERLEACVALLQPTLDNIELSVAVRPDSLTVHADRQLLDQVLVNLVRNAADAIGDRPGGRVSLEAGLDFGCVVISVTDNGTGIPADELDQVFIPFFTTKRDGSGIGLSFCRQVMIAHDGEIALESTDGGTVARLVFR